MQRANDVAASLRSELSAALQNQRLPMAAHIRNQLNAFWRVHKCAPVVLLGQRMKAARFGHGEGMADVARPLSKQRLQFAGVKRLVEVRRNVEGARGLLQLKT